MKKVFYYAVLFLTGGLQSAYSQKSLPHLYKYGTATQLIVHDKPFLILGGELGNSTATTVENMQPVWPKLSSMHLNTILVPVYWELIEAEEGRFDFSLYSNLITEARKNKLKIVFLWFGAWKNSMSSHAPAWVKLDQKKYPRVKDQTGKSLEILSSFSDNVLQADIAAFEHLVAFIKNFDSDDNTVIMMQVENEIGMLSSAKDYQTLAAAAFRNNIPNELAVYLEKHAKDLVPEFKSILKAHGNKTKGNWEKVFGSGSHTDEIFMAYYYSLFANRLAAAGKKIYNIPMYVNAALNKPGKLPGEYPSAGPLPHLLDVWKAGGNAIDFFSPDFYNPDFEYWNDLYTRRDNPLFIPEHAFDASVAAKALFSFARYDAIGFSPFSIESANNETLGDMYKLIASMQALITANQGKNKIKGILLDKNFRDSAFVVGKYMLTCKHDYTLSWTPGSKTDVWPYAAAMIIQVNEDEFFIAGTGIVITFKNNVNKELNVGLLKVDEGVFENNVWRITRHLNGDQTHQGRHVNIPVSQVSVQRVKLYDYE